MANLKCGRCGLSYPDTHLHRCDGVSSTLRRTPEHDAAKQRAHACQLALRGVRFTGAPDDSVAELLRAVDYMLSPSDWRESHQRLTEQRVRFTLDTPAEAEGEQG